MGLTSKKTEKWSPKTRDFGLQFVFYACLLFPHSRSYVFPMLSFVFPSKAFHEKGLKCKEAKVESTRSNNRIQQVQTRLWEVSL